MMARKTTMLSDFDDFVDDDDGDASKRKYLGPRVPDDVLDEVAVEKYVKKVVEKHRKNRMTEAEILQGQEAILEEFGNTRPGQSVLEAARSTKGAPFVVLCAKVLAKARRGEDSQKRMQGLVRLSTAQLSGTQLYAEWERCMYPVTAAFDRNALTFPASNPRAALYDLVLSTQLSTASTHAGLSTLRDAVQAVERIAGVACHGVFAFPRTLQIAVVFDYHDTERFAVVCVFAANDTALSEEVVPGSYADPCLSFSPPYLVDDADASAKKPKGPSDAALSFFGSGPAGSSVMLFDPRWRTAPVEFINYVYFDRVRCPFNHLIVWAK